MVIIPGMDIMSKKVNNAQNIPWLPDIRINHDPVDVAAYWKKQGAERLYIADMDGARFGEPENLDVVKRIIDNVDIKVFLGGGIRSADSAKRAFDIGVKKIVIGTSVAFAPEFGEEMFSKYREDVIVTLGNINGYVAIQDGAAHTDESVFDFAKRMEDQGAKYIVFNDIQRKGAHGGPNMYLIQKIKERLKEATLIVGSGVSTLGDIERLRELKIVAAIMVTALYYNMVDYKEAVKVGRVL